MDMLTIFVSQLVLSFLVYALIAKWYVVPWLANKPIELVLIALIFPHALRQAQAVPYLGATWYIPTSIVPMLLVAHVMIFSRLLTASRRQLSVATS